MRYSAEHKQETRNRIVRAAARQFCRPEGKGSAIADLMREALANHIDRYLMDPTSFSGPK